MVADAKDKSFKAEGKTPSGKKITYAQLEQHNTEGNCWMAIHDNVYDVTEFLPSHPGGTHMFMLGAGRDVTYLFESYHKVGTTTHFLQNSPKVKLVGQLESCPTPAYAVRDNFLLKLKSRTEDYFRKNGIDSRVSNAAYLNAVIIFAMFAFAYWITLIKLPAMGAPMWATVLGGIAIGVVHHLSMVHIYHDCSHGSFGHNPWVWNIVGYTADIVTGHSFFVWLNRHVVGHHIYTNVAEFDPDVGDNKNGGIYRSSPAQKWEPKYRFQHLYQPFLYTLVAFKMQFDDMTTMLTDKMENIRVNNCFAYKFTFWALRAVFLFTRLVLPTFFGTSFATCLVAFLAAHLTAGLWFGFFSQITHVSEEISWPRPPIADEWAKLQVTTARDYGHDSFLWTWLGGKLNFQVAHHLFPSYSQEHYPAIQHIVTDTCKEHNVDYRVLPTFWSAVSLHMSHLKQMGSGPGPVPVPASVRVSASAKTSRKRD